VEPIDTVTLFHLLEMSKSKRNSLGLLSFILAISPLAGAFQQSSVRTFSTTPSLKQRSRVVLDDFRRRNTERYYPDEREYSVIDTRAYDDGLGYPRDARQGRGDFGAMGGYYDGEIDFVEDDDIARHLWIVVWATCWWYVYNGLNIVAHPPATDAKAPFFFQMDKETIQMFGAILAFLPVPIYGALARLSKSYSLQEGQVAITFLGLVAAPAYAIIAVFNPLHNRSWSTLGLFATTMFIGTFVAHHLRQAAIREGPRPTEEAIRFERAEIASEALQDYRPPLYYQSTQVAAKLTRDMVSFHVAICAITSTLLFNKQTFWDLFPFSAECWPWILVMIHMGHNCMITALFPGAQLGRFRTYVLADSALYGVHIYAALSSPIVQQWLSSPEGLVAKGPHSVIGDQIVVLWFVADAAMQLIGPLGRILQSIDFDEKFNLSPMQDRIYYNDEFDGQRYLPPGPPPRR
jgi:hypothetical protein